MKHHTPEAAPITVTSDGGLALGDTEARPSDWLIVRLAAIAHHDRNGPAAVAARLLADHGYLLPVPRPAVAVWSKDDHARIRHALDRLQVSDEEAGMFIDGRYLTDLPEDEAWRTIREIAACNARIEAALARMEDRVRAQLDAIRTFMGIQPS
jgi:hypothetical protein